MSGETDVREPNPKPNAEKRRKYVKYGVAFLVTLLLFLVLVWYFAFRKSVPSGATRIEGTVTARIRDAPPRKQGRTE